MIVSWTPVEGAIKYYVNCDGQVTDVGTDTSYTHTGLSPGTLNTYKVMAYKSGVDGIWSNPVSDYTLLDTPSNVVAGSTNDKITIWWSAVDGASSYDVNIGGTTYNTTGTSYACDGLNPGTAYTYSVKAKNSVTESEWSIERTKSTITNPPTTPQGLDGDPDITSITLTWNSVSGASGYDLEIDGSVRNVGDNTTYKHTGLDPGSGHTYRIRTRNSGGKSGWSDALTISTIPLPPNVPENLRSAETENTIIIEWDPVADSTGYDIRINNTYDISVTDAVYIHTGLEPGSRHTYRVRTINDGGERGDWSDALVVSTLPGLPGPPDNVYAIPDVDKIIISWDPHSDADSYNIEINGGEPISVTDSVYIHAGLPEETQYTYRIQTVTGEEESAWSSPVTVSTLSNKPPVPVNVAGIPSSSSIKLV